MTVDREQIRAGHGNAADAFALLVELERAEEKLNFGMDASQVATLVLRHRESEARLAKVPALVEAVKGLLEMAEGFDRQIHRECGVDEYVEDEFFAEVRAVIAAWEPA